MALSIKSDEADRLARELSAATGESITEAITIALEDRLARQRGNVEATRRRLEAIRADLAGVRPDMTMTDEEILGFGDDGLPT